MCRPSAHAFARCDTESAAIEFGDDMFDGLTHLGRRSRNVDIRAILPRIVDDLFQLNRHYFFPPFTNATMRCAASTHSSVSATSAIRMRPFPGFPPSVVRAR